MRKSILILAVATSFLAACSNEKVLNDVQTSSNPAVIGFGTYAEKPTKGDIRTYETGVMLEDYHKSFVVYGTKYSNIVDDADTVYVFGDKASATSAVAGTVCDYVDNNHLFHGSNWKYTDERFWDKQATYDFVAFAPKFAPLAYKYDTNKSRVGAKGNIFLTTSTFELCGQNLQDIQETSTLKHLDEILVGFTKDSVNEAGKDIDIMISEVNRSQDGNDYINKTASDNKDVNLQFHHVLAKLNVTIAKSNKLDTATVVIKSVSLDSLKYKGTFNGSNWVAVDREPGDDTYSIKFNANDNSVNYSIIPASTDTKNKKYYIESIVMPQDLSGICNLTIKYSIKKGIHEESYISCTNINDNAIITKFQDRYNYTLNVTIDPTYITFDAKADTWDYTNDSIGYKLH